MSFQNPFKCTYCNWRGKHVVGLPLETIDAVYRCPICIAKVEPNVCSVCQNLIYDCPECAKDYSMYGMGSDIKGQRLYSLLRSNDPSYDQEVGALNEWYQMHHPTIR